MLRSLRASPQPHSGAVLLLVLGAVTSCAATSQQTPSGGAMPGAAPEAPGVQASSPAAAGPEAAKPSVAETTAAPASAATTATPAATRPSALSASLDASVLLSSIKITQTSSIPPDTVLLRTRRAPDGKFGEVTRRGAKQQPASAAGGAEFLVQLKEYPKSHDPVLSAHKACSFLIDCAEPVFQTTQQELLQRFGPKPEPERVVEFVHDFISKKNYSRGLDLASVVAQRREGDCTEHAVLLAALLRLNHVPSRVVTGALLLRLEGRWQAFGHAWVEYRAGPDWRLADATRDAQGTWAGSAASNGPSRVHYIPVRSIEDEGPGYRSGLLQSVDVTQIEEFAFSE